VNRAVFEDRTNFFSINSISVARYIVSTPRRLQLRCQLTCRNLWSRRYCRDSRTARHLPPVLCRHNGQKALPVKGYNDFKGIRWCCQRGLNSRPLPYQGSALPLSYGSKSECGAFCHINPAYASDVCALSESCRRCHRAAIMTHNFGGAVAIISRGSWAMTKDAAGKDKKDNTRRKRLAEELRANLQKRKAQSRSRRTGGADSRPEGIAASTKNSND
jgi:hypothetical protein